jgi:hypothetical protein
LPHLGKQFELDKSGGIFATGSGTFTSEWVDFNKLLREQQGIASYNEGGIASTRADILTSYAKMCPV